MRFVRWLTSPRGVAVSLGLDVLAIVVLGVTLTLAFIIGIGETPTFLLVTLGIVLVGAVIRAIEGVRKLRGFRRSQSASAEEPPAAS